MLPEGIVPGRHSHPKWKGSREVQLVPASREEKIDEILAFVMRNRESHASRTVCKEMLGLYYAPLAGETREQLAERLSSADEEQLDYCYYLIK